MNNPVINPVINHEMRLTTSAGVLQVTARESLREGQRVWVGFRPGSVQVGPNNANTLAATVESRRPQGGWERLTLTLPGGGRIIATLPPHAVPPEETVPAPLTVHVRPQDLLLLPDSSVPELP